MYPYFLNLDIDYFRYNQNITIQTNYFYIIVNIFNNK